MAMVNLSVKLLLHGQGPPGSTLTAWLEAPQTCNQILAIVISQTICWDCFFIPMMAFLGFAMMVCFEFDEETSQWWTMQVIMCFQESSWFTLMERLVPANLDVFESNSQSEIQRYSRLKHSMSIRDFHNGLARSYNNAALISRRPMSRTYIYIYICTHMIYMIYTYVFKWEVKAFYFFHHVGS